MVTTKRQVLLGTAAVLGIAALSFSVRPAHAQEDPPPAPPAGQAPAPGQGPGGGGRRGQGRQGGMQNPAMMVPAAFAATNPTADQQTKFDALNKQMMSDRRAAMQGVEPADRPAKMQAMQAKYLTDVKALLTDDQKKTFDAEMAKAPTRGGMNLNMMLRPLNLTADQQTKVDPIVKDTQDQMAKLMADTSGDRRANMQKVQTLMTDMKAKIRPLLTPEQQTTLDGMNMRGGGRPGGGGGRRNGGQGGGEQTPPPPPAPTL